MRAGGAHQVAHDAQAHGWQVYTLAASPGKPCYAGGRCAPGRLRRAGSRLAGRHTGPAPAGTLRHAHGGHSSSMHSECAKKRRSPVRASLAQVPLRASSWWYANTPQMHHSCTACQTAGAESACIISLHALLVHAKSLMLRHCTHPSVIHKWTSQGSCARNEQPCLRRTVWHARLIRRQPVPFGLLRGGRVLGLPLCRHAALYACQKLIR